MTHVDLAVVGGGLMGLSTALAAARRGLRVIVLERESIGRHASSASAGGVRSLNRHPDEIPLARAALNVWDGLAADLGGDVGFVRSGQIRVAQDAVALASLEHRAQTTRALGFVHEEIIGANALAHLEPALARTCQGAMVVRDDGYADPLKTIHAYRQAVQNAGVTVRQGAAVSAIERAGDGIALSTNGSQVLSRAVVNAAGAWGGVLAESVGEPVPMATKALQMTVTEAMPPLVSAVIGSEGRKLSLKQTGGGHLVIGGAYEGTVDDHARTGRPIPARVAQNLANASALLPQLSRARVARTWAGLEGCTADALPVIGESRRLPGLVHAFGFSAHGFALAPLIGPIVADIIEGHSAPETLLPFSIDRFQPPASTP